MKNKRNRMIAWAMRYHKIIFLVTGLFIIAGFWGLRYMPKQEFPSFTILQGVVVGVYPGATSSEVAEQLAKPIEQFLFKFKEVNRKKTYSQSRDGIVYIYVTLIDGVKNKNEVWSKIRHGLTEFKKELSPDILAILVDDDFGETSSLLLTIESKSKTYRQLEEYLKRLEDQLRKESKISYLSRYGMQNEEIAIYLDKNKMTSYGISTTELGNSLFTQGLTNYSGEVETEKEIIPIYISKSYQTEEDLAEQIIKIDDSGAILRLKDIARVTREYPKSENYISSNGTKCLLLSIEMQLGNDVTQFECTM